MKTLTMFFYLLLGSALTIFIYSNFEQSVVIHFTDRYRTTAIPLALALFGAMVAGFLVAALLAFTHQFRLRNRMRQLRKTNERLESEIAGLRNLPLTSLPSSAGRSDSESQDRELGPSVD
ncbi:MAG TPA: LapA family protein [Vicinamibacteria bacterium]|jgi:uncharacterized integral membrane protein